MVLVGAGVEDGWAKVERFTVTSGEGRRRFSTSSSLSLLSYLRLGDRHVGW
jgi:hypothetical protein